MTAPRRVLHVGPWQPVPAGGIAAYVLGLLRAPWPPSVRHRVADTTVPAAAESVRALRPLVSIRIGASLVWHLITFRPHIVHVHTSDYLGFWEKGLFTAIARGAGAALIAGGTWMLVGERLVK